MALSRRTHSTSNSILNSDEHKDWIQRSSSRIPLWEFIGIGSHLGFPLGLYGNLRLLPHLVSSKFPRDDEKKTCVQAQRVVRMGLLGSTHRYQS